MTDQPDRLASPLCVTLDDVLTPAQIAMLAQRIQSIVRNSGFGKITITVTNKRVEFIETEIREKI